MDEMKSFFVAPCGINCRLCSAYGRKKNPCGGCVTDSEQKVSHCSNCSIKYCEEKQGNETAFCYTCTKYPCRRLRQLDLRYRTKYRTSVLKNLECIRDHGMEAFLKSEEEQQKCTFCGGIVCMHSQKCFRCQVPREQD